MKRYGKISLLLLLLGAGAIFGFQKCGGGTPPASIPTPIASSINAGVPGPGGATLVTGGPQAALGGATIEAANISQGGSLSLMDLLIPPAFAQTFEVTTTAATDGSFSFLIDAFDGDTIAIRQTLNGEVSDPVNIPVP